MNSREEILDVWERLGAAIATNVPERVASLYTEDCAITDSAMQIRGRQGLLEALRYFHDAFEILAISFEEPIIDGHRVAGRARWRAIHRGEYLGVPGSGREFESWNFGFLEIRNGLIARDNSVWDASELLRLRAQADEG